MNNFVTVINCFQCLPTSGIFARIVDAALPGSLFVRLARPEC